MILGIVLIVIGSLFILLALIAAARKVLLRSHPAQPEPAGLGPFDPEKWAKLIDALTSFVKAAPEWVLLAVVGGALVAWGGSML